MFLSNLFVRGSAPRLDLLGFVGKVSPESRHDETGCQGPKIHVTI
jgi:hypothetical protein